MKHRQMNPAFAAAHGISSSTFGRNDPSGRNETNTKSNRLEVALRRARATGKLLLVDSGIATPLSNKLFDLRAGVEVNLSLDQQQQSLASQQHTEETLEVVDLSDNQEITGTVDERFIVYQQAQQLKFKRCQWSSMNHSLANLEYLVGLDLSGNILTEFDVCLLPLNIQQLDLSGNRLQSLKSSAGLGPYQLKTLDISNNQLVSLDDSAVSFPTLRHFICHHNRINKFPTSFLSTAQDSIEIIDVSCNQISEKLDLSKYSNLKTAKCALNRLSAVPTIPNSLTTLDLTTNMIKTIEGMLLPSTDDDSQSTPSLVDLMLHENHLEELDPLVIEKCIHLQRLDVCANKLKNLPYQLALLPNIKTIRIASNPLFTFKRSDVENNPDAVLEVLRRRAPKKEEGSSKNVLSSIQKHSIDLSVPKAGSRGFAAPTVTPDLNQLVNDLMASPETAQTVTARLALSGFDGIPKDLFSLLPNVSEIVIPGNSISKFPDPLATSCSRLQNLDLSRNKLASLSRFPSPLAWSQSMKHLNLSCNRIDQFPVELLSQLVVLESLNLSSNRLESTHECKMLPSTLKHLELSENHIQDIESLVWTLARCCPEIKSLRIAQNKVSKIPLVLGLFLETRLTALDLRFNPQQAVRHAILEKSCKEQLSYLKNRLTKEQATNALNQLAQDTVGSTTERKTTSEDALVPDTKGDEKANCAMEKPIVEKQPEVTNDAVEKAAEEEQVKITNDEVDDKERQASLSLIAEYKEKIQSMQKEFDTNFSLSQAKRYALKKQIAMERSKMIREERKIGLRK
eukprot:scaffold374_cov124-Cylindrotheca_fusiformis.AAC.14